MDEYKEKILALCKGYNINKATYLYKTGKRISFELDGMPILPFFIKLAETFGVPIDRVTTSVSGHDVGGCPTCGPEIEITVGVTVTLL